MKIKTSDLSGMALDWAVAKLEHPNSKVKVDYKLLMESRQNSNFYMDYSPSSDWAQGGPIIEREGINLGCMDPGNYWYAYDFVGDAHSRGQTPLIAAMRCYVASKMGERVEVPGILASEE